MNSTILQLAVINGKSPFWKPAFFWIFLMLTMALSSIWIMVFIPSSLIHSLRNIFRDMALNDFIYTVIIIALIAQALTFVVCILFDNMCKEEMYNEIALLMTSNSMGVILSFIRYTEVENENKRTMAFYITLLFIIWSFIMVYFTLPFLIKDLKFAISAN